MAETINTRVARLEAAELRAWKAIGALADKQAKLDDVLALLLEAQIKTEKQFQESAKWFQESEKRFQESEKQFQESAKRFQETAKRFQETDLRIEKLVSAIGEFLRKNGK